MSYENIEVRTEAGKVGIVTLNRPKALNALNDALIPSSARRSRPSTPTSDRLHHRHRSGARLRRRRRHRRDGQLQLHRRLQGDYITRNWEPSEACAAGDRGRNGLRSAAAASSR